jgi:hypothetical protein
VIGKIADRINQATTEEEFMTVMIGLQVTLSGLGITEADMKVFSNNWIMRFGEVPPTLAMAQEFLGVLRDSLMEIAMSRTNSGGSQIDISKIPMLIEKIREGFSLPTPE